MEIVLAFQVLVLFARYRDMTRVVAVVVIVVVVLTGQELDDKWSE